MRLGATLETQTSGTSPVGTEPEGNTMSGTADATVTADAKVVSPGEYAAVGNSKAITSQRGNAASANGNNALHLLCGLVEKCCVNELS